MNQWELSDPGAGHASIAIAIDKGKNSQITFKWALDNIINRGATVALVHVTKPSSGGLEDPHLRDLFVSFRCFSQRKEVICKDIVLEDHDVAKAIVEFVSQAGIEKLVLGSPSKSGFARTFKSADLASVISKSTPEFCTVYTISKGKLGSVRNATRPVPAVAPSVRSQIYSQTSVNRSEHNEPYRSSSGMRGEAAYEARSLHREPDTIKSPFTRPGVRGTAPKAIGDMTDISFVSSGRPSVEYMYPQRLSNVSDIMDNGFDALTSPTMSGVFNSSGNGLSSLSSENSPSQRMSLQEDVESEMKRLRLELKQTMDMYSTACKEALSAKQKAMELHRWKVEEERRLEEARLSEEAALALAEEEKAKCRAAMEAAEKSKRLAELEAKKRIMAEMKVQKESDERKKAFSSFGNTDMRYRKYSIEEIETATENFADKRKIGEGGYGPVYRCYLDHTPVAIKVLRPDAAQGMSQFQQEIEILSCIRHPNMVLLLGACPEFGCIVYEYMGNGSLEDRLFRRGNTPPIPWQYRFRIAAEIGTGLLFLHQSKPEPLVHRDLKPANILLDRNYVSKISDVGLARLVPPSVADNVTQYLMTSTAGTFCYIDPEYQQSGMLGTKSDIYSLGIILLQILTGKPPMGLTHHVERSIEKGKFVEMLDSTVTDWPVEEALSMAKLALKCAELRRKDRPDLGTVILPELDRLRELAEDSSQQLGCGTFHNSPRQFSSQLSSHQEVMSSPLGVQSGGYENPRSRFSGSNTSARKPS